MENLEFTAESAFRADVFVTNKTGLTRSRVKKLFDAGLVLANGQPVKAGQTLKEGALVAVTIPDPVPVGAQAEDIPLSVVYEDDDLAVIDKPQGMVVHAGAGHETGTLVNACLFRLKSLSGIGGALRPGIVHRLDKDTSGLMLVAKNDRAHLSLCAQIKSKTCRREYLALLEGVLKEDKGTVLKPLGRDGKDRKRYTVVAEGQGKSAETEYVTEERFRAYTLVRFRLRTGRTHQIRVHAKYLGHPVVGDRTYGYRRSRFPLEGQLLHACLIEFEHPVTGERMRFEAPLPDYFTRILETVRKEK